MSGVIPTAEPNLSSVGAGQDCEVQLTPNVHSSVPRGVQGL